MKTCLALERSFGALRQPQDDTLLTTRPPLNLHRTLDRSVCRLVKEIYTLADLQNWDRIQQEAACPIRLGVIGDPVGHSLSPQMQNAALKHCKINMQSVRLQISEDKLGESLKQIRKLDFVGVNLTVPHKIKAL